MYCFGTYIVNNKTGNSIVISDLQIENELKLIIIDILVVKWIYV